MELCVDINEIAKYLGYGDHIPDQAALSQIREAVDLAKEAAEFKVKHLISDIHIGNACISMQNLSLSSVSLAKHLVGCSKAVLFCATLGAGVDRLISRYAVTNMSFTVILDAAASALLEAYCDKWQEDFEREQLVVLRESFGLRFSPGYGDWNIDVQPSILSLLDAKRIGICLTNGGMLAPTKSITAIAGILPEGLQRCKKKNCHDCANCDNLDCAYRKK